MLIVGASLTIVSKTAARRRHQDSRNAPWPIGPKRSRWRACSTNSSICAFVRHSLRLAPRVCRWNPNQSSEGERQGFLGRSGAGRSGPPDALKGARLLANCDVLVYDYLAAAPIVAMTAPAAERIYVGKRAGSHAMPQAEISALLVRLAREGKHVVRLKGGDIFVFARGGEETRELRDAGVPFEVVPGITSALAAPAYAGIPITHRRHNTSFVVATGHEDPNKDGSTLDFAKLANPAQTLIFLMAMVNLAGIIERLREHGLAADTPVAIVREGTKPAQQTLIGTLATIVDDVARERFVAPAIVVVGSVVRERIPWFETGPLFGKRVLITRPAGSADAFAAALWEAGAEPVCKPAIAFDPPDDETAAEEAVRYVRAYAWLVFTSANGVRCFFERLTKQGGDARRLGDVHVAAIGPKTATALDGFGIRADLVASAYVAEALAEELLVATRRGDRLLLIYRAQEARDVLPRTLRDRGRSGDVVPALKTTLVRDPESAAAAAGNGHLDVHKREHRRRISGERSRRDGLARRENGRLHRSGYGRRGARRGARARRRRQMNSRSEGLLRALELAPA